MKLVKTLNALSADADWLILGVVFSLCLTYVIAAANAGAGAPAKTGAAGRPWLLVPQNLFGSALVGLIMLPALLALRAPVLALAGGPVAPAMLITLSLFGAVVMTGIAALPISAFLIRGWDGKRQDVLSSLGDQAINLYVETFLGGGTNIAYRGGSDGKRQDVLSSLSDQAIKLYVETFLGGGTNTAHRARFCAMYDQRYGRYRLREPCILLALTLFPLALLVSHTALVRLHGDSCTGAGCPLVLPGQALAAIAGAYAFVIAALVRGAITYNLPPLVMVNAALRLLIAAPLGYAVALFGVGRSEFFAFAIGAFPLDEVQTIFHRVTTRYFNPSTTSCVTDDATDKTLALDGIDQRTSESLAAFDITTAVQLAYCDPVRLSLGTNIAFDVILDLQSEALAYIYLGGLLDAVRPFGLRGAVEIRNLMRREKTAAARVIAAACAVTNLNEAGLRNCFHEIADDPYTEFLANCWSSRRRDTAGAGRATP